MYNSWKKYLIPEVELCPIELSGRGRRINEPFYNDVEEAVEDVYQIIKDDIRCSPYMLFGHSMGALISYILAQKIKADGLISPLHLFLSGKAAIHTVNSNSTKFSSMNDKEFKDAIIDLGGTPPEVFENKEFSSIFLPLLRSDFKMAEEYRHFGIINPLESPITVFIGNKDTITIDKANEWIKHTNKTFNIVNFNGGHFFLHEEYKQMISVINSVVDNLSNSLS